jgi:hypothetical protein
VRSSQPTGGQHAFLPYLANMQGVSKDWYEFLIAHHIFFTHPGASYCAIEDRMVRPPEFRSALSTRIGNDKGCYRQQVMQRLPAMQGPRTLRTARRVIQDIEAAQMLRKGTDSGVIRTTSPKLYCFRCLVWHCMIIPTYLRHPLKRFMLCRSIGPHRSAQVV